MSTTAFATLQSQIGGIIGDVQLGGAFGTSLQPNPANTTTAVNLLIVVNGIPQGLIRSMSIDENFGYVRVKAISSPVDVAEVPGVYEGTASVSRAFLLGQDLETAFGGNLRAVVGTQQANQNFTAFYFSIVTVDNLGNILKTYHDCALASVRSAYEIESVIIMQDASIYVRWTD
jgi:hypothetical protein